MRNILYITALCCLLAACGTSPFTLPAVAVITETPTLPPLPGRSPIATLTALPTATHTPLPTSTPTQTPTITATPCIPAGEPDAFTCEQFSAVLGQGFSFLYSSETRSPENIYSLNYVLTTAAFGITWKFVSGFIVGVSQPASALYPTEGVHKAFGDFSFIYLKARFYDRAGASHDYWMQLLVIKQYPTISVLRWSKPVADNLEEHPDANSIIAAGQNSDGSPAVVDVSAGIPAGLLRINDQFVVQVAVADVQNKGALRGMEKPGYIDVLNQFVAAVEGGADFPVASDGFFLPVDGLLIPMSLP